MEDFKPSLEKVFKDLEGFTYETKMYVYHKLNGRDKEAETYLATYKHEQKLMKSELEPCVIPLKQDSKADDKVLLKQEK